MTTFLERQLFSRYGSGGSVQCTAVEHQHAAYAYGKSHRYDSGQVVLGRLEDVGGGALQFNELDRSRDVAWSLVFHNSTLVCGGEHGIVLFDVSAGTLNQCGVLRGHTDAVLGVAAHGDWLASISRDRTVRIWSMTTRAELHCKTDYTKPVDSVCFSHNGRWLVSEVDWEQRVIVYDATRDFARHTTLTLNGVVRAVCFSPDDSLLAVGASWGCSALYSVDAFEPLRTLVGGDTVWSVAWLGNDAASLVGGTRGGDLVVWNTSTGNVTSHETVHISQIFSLSFTSSFRTLLTASDDQTMRVFDVYNRHESRATAALYRASLHVFRTLRRTDVGALVMQLVAEWLAGESAPLDALSEHERTRIFTASRVTSDVRLQRLASLEALEKYHARMRWLRTSTPAYSSSELEPLGKDNKK